MTKVVVKETANEEAAIPAKKARQKVTVTDSLGRTITLREIDPIQQSRITLGLGNDAAMNTAYMTAFVFPAAMVESIDEDIYGVPVSIRQVEAALKELGTEGLAAIFKHLEDKAQRDEDQAAKN